MDPVVTVLRFGEVERIIGSYGLLLGLAILIVGAMTVRAAARAGIDVGATIAVVGFTATGAAVGATGLFVLVEWARTGDPLHGLTQPGLVFFGAPLGGAPALVLAARQLELPLGRLVDVATPAVPTAHAVGRLGCFLGGCCYGAPFDGPWAVTYTHPLAPAAYPSVPRHPVPLYESGGLLLLALAFTLIPPRAVGRGRRLATYFACYGVLRVAVEGFRGDAVRGLLFDGLLSTSQLIGGLITILCVAWLWATRRGRSLAEARPAV